MEPRNYPKVFVVILNYNGGESIRNCLDAVFHLDYPNLEVIFVDNNSTDGSLELAKKIFARFYFIKNEKNIGFAAGNNVGIQLALKKGADYVFLLNNDATVEKDVVLKLVQTGEDIKKSGILNPLIIDGNSNGVWFSGGEIKWFSMKAVHIPAPRFDKPFKTDYATGCAMLVKKEVFEKIGLLDEKFFLYYEDVDFCLRAQKAGFESWIVPEARVVHFEKSELSKRNKVYWLVISGILFFRKNTPWFVKPWMYIYLFLRKMKNCKDFKDNNNEIAKVVRKAYQDLKNEK